MLSQPAPSQGPFRARLFARAALVWLLLAVLAIACGILRQLLLAPRLGDAAAHVIGTLAVVALFTAVLWRAVPWVAPAWPARQLLGLGAAWTAATVAFEFGFGRYVIGHPWSRLLADYNFLRGRLWILVLLTILLVPPVAGRRRA